MRWCVNGFALSSTDFGLNNKIHINFSNPPTPSPQYSYKYLITLSRHTDLRSSLKFTHKLWSHTTALHLQKSVIWKKNYFLFVLASQIGITFPNGTVRINRSKKDKIWGTIAQYVMCTISTKVLKTCPSSLLLFKV